MGRTSSRPNMFGLGVSQGLGNASQTLFYLTPPLCTTALQVIFEHLNLRRTARIHRSAPAAYETLSSIRSFLMPSQPPRIHDHHIFFFSPLYYNPTKLVFVSIEVLADGGKSTEGKEPHCIWPTVLWFQGAPVITYSGVCCVLCVVLVGKS
ncbi:hypothetical protein SODALDRAFT_101247 [Sodiomyces alkalinus F11]|uniref:Uncharacterized protein n=1 Tax=Sodiomyces alkalinus (strain CBS 110278 / VKM F-3762 / F11) TaxID=1314773 RepID=A0A3N2Q1L7_SODAK|nr:hypothetical protein SODALDRAFT_101247 [Sodiomyces alkalinus F11]ROT40632.1 hypothetical protein SODALDRAFT_101247 [Sodiomyces alkalinus F11]